MHGRHGGAGRRETRDIWSGLVVGAGEARRCIDTSASGGIQSSTEGLRGQGRIFLVDPERATRYPECTAISQTHPRRIPFAIEGVGPKNRRTVTCVPVCSSEDPRFPAPQCAVDGEPLLNRGACASSVCLRPRRGSPGERSTTPRRSESGAGTENDAAAVGFAEVLAHPRGRGGVSESALSVAVASRRYRAGAIRAQRAC